MMEKVSEQMDVNKKRENDHASHDAEAACVPVYVQEKFIEFVKNRFGIVIKSGHRELIKTIHSECTARGISPEEYLAVLTKSDNTSEAATKFVSTITIGETYFFRDKQQIKLLSEVVLPQILERKNQSGNKILRIWSAGCSSGEEIYTIVMLLKNLVNDFSGWQCRFLATDINIHALKRGIDGKYSEWSMRSIPQEYLDRYFIKKDKTYALKNEIKDMVEFEYLNLSSDTYPSLLSGTMMQDLIVCRNVLIYFDMHHIGLIMDKLSRCMAEDGYMLLGASDPITISGSGLIASRHCPSLLSLSSDAMPETSIRTEYSEGQIVSPPIQPHFENVGQSPIQRHTPIKKKTTIIDEISMQKMYDESRWQELLDLISQYEMANSLTIWMMTKKAMALASLGKITESIKACDACLQLDKMNKEAYFIKALDLSELRELKDAEVCFRKALYIDSEYLICRYQLGLLLIRVGKVSEGTKSLLNVISTAKSMLPDELVPGTNNMSYGDLVTVLTHEVELHQ